MTIIQIHSIKISRTVYTLQRYCVVKLPALSGCVFPPSSLAVWILIVCGTLDISAISVYDSSRFQTRIWSKLNEYLLGILAKVSSNVTYNPVPLTRVSMTYHPIPASFGHPKQMLFFVDMFVH